MGKTGIAGNTGDSVRSDCLVSLELRESGGLNIDLKSKVAPLYGDAIRQLCQQELNFLGIDHAGLFIDDRGSLDFVLAARIEAAVKQCFETHKELLPELIPENQSYTERGRFRRSRLYLPGNTPKFMLNAGIHQPDGIIFDLEDSVAPSKKEEARILVRNALRQVNFYGAERMVRINQLPRGLEDLESVVPHLVFIPKCETAEQVRQVADHITRISQKHQLASPPHLMPIIESASGVINAYSIASASEHVAALAIGLEDYCAD